LLWQAFSNISQTVGGFLRERKTFSGIDGKNQATAAGSLNFVKNLCKMPLKSAGTSIMAHARIYQ